jgi:hypothetical protein
MAAQENQNVFIRTDAQQPVRIEMAANLIAKEEIPVCIRVCEPICAKSDYTISLDIFGNPFAAITVRGLTRIYNCREE